MTSETHYKLMWLSKYLKAINALIESRGVLLLSQHFEHKHLISMQDDNKQPLDVTKKAIQDKNGVYIQCG